MLTSQLGDQGPRQLARIVERANLVVISFDAPHWQVAAEAWLRFGRGRHEAALNFGDCLAYATARLAGQPMLCKGENFSKTDLAVA